MNLENIGTGAGSGILAAILTYIGFKQRLDRADTDIADLKTAVMFKDVHEVCAGAHNQQLKDMYSKLDYIIKRVDAK